MSKHRFKIGDFLVDEHFPWICGEVKQLLTAGGRNKWACYLVVQPKTGNEEVIMDSHVKRVFIPYEDHVVMVEYAGDYVRSNAPLEEVLKIRPEILQFEGV